MCLVVMLFEQRSDVLSGDSDMLVEIPSALAVEHCVEGFGCVTLPVIHHDHALPGAFRVAGIPGVKSLASNSTAQVCLAAALRVHLFVTADNKSSPFYELPGRHRSIKQV